MSNPFAQIGVVTGYEYIQNREGEQTVTMLQVSLSEEDDVQSVELYQPVGRNGPPTIDSAVIVISIAEGFKIAIGINDGLDVSELSEGDILAYSQDEDGVRRTEVKQENDGTLTLSSIDNDELGCASQTLQNSGVVDIQNENGSINMAANGIVSVGNGDDFVAMANKVNDIFAAIHAIMIAWTPVYETALKTAWTTEFGSGPWSEEVSSSNLKADE